MCVCFVYVCGCLCLMGGFVCVVFVCFGFVCMLGLCVRCVWDVCGC